ncbi:protein-disulfide reductase DsbD domain-containing protein [Mitsuaria sp. GD03876]|uniref:protein-disulfide reductase DsbD family protein n=1 Tax=Mitsuaria sp. GD03876 TaxID=2975399 RepID=UPI00244C345F|nr:protein-disulfide reductase DsbD domain-containing protein [Mitsuaria sp. GD03876]MDH0863092.1 protein-disulfide reductase DsbD family protein [Mitsuaria sp. GD03876]
MISASSRVAPGQTVQVALEQRIAPHWHTYWKNPGDSGQPTSIEWSLPKGATASEIHWPAPKRFDVGPITNYGYEDQVLLLTEIRLPQDLTPGSTATLTAEATWLVCREECIPQQATLALSLPVAASPTPSSDAARLSTALSSLPPKAPFDATSRIDGKDLVVSWPAAATSGARQALFMPNEWGRIQHAAKPVLDRDGDAWRLRMPVGEQPASAGQALEGLLLVDGKAWEVRMPVGGGASPGDGSDLSLWTAMGLALIGGLILNLMPCVFPVLAIKALGFLQGSAREHRRQGLAYTAGVLAAFAALGVVLLALRGAGDSIGWGFQFHSSLFVLLLAWLMFVLGLSLAGQLQIGAGFAGIGQGLASRPGLAGSFFTGVLATVVATPCTAPFMGAAMAFALAQPAPELMAVFLSLGLGLALPYLALACWPALQRRLPRPGPWMEVLKQALAFPMFAAAIWLVWVLAQQAGPMGVLVALAGMGLVALAAWVRAVSRHASPRWRWIGGGTALAAVVATAALVPSLSAITDDSSSASVVATGLDGASGGVVGTGGSGSAGDVGGGRAKPVDNTHEPYSPERLAQLRAQGKPVFVNLTASWCITCLVNERVALSTDEVREAFTRQGVTYLKGDWTRQDPRITALLKQHDRSGVPLYLFYPAGTGSSAQVLPQLLTPGIVTSALRAGAPSVP